MLADDFWQIVELACGGLERSFRGAR
jgi:hypothetical protein